MKAEGLQYACEREKDNRRRKENTEPEVYLTDPSQNVSACLPRFRGARRTESSINCCHDIHRKDATGFAVVTPPKLV